MMEYEYRVVAFIDILGFKEMIKVTEFEKSRLKLLYDTLLFLKGKEKASEWNLQYIEIEEDAQKKGIEKFDISGKISCSCFSDSIIISVQLNQDINEVVSTLITNLSFIGAKLIMDGILLRGAITIGNVIHTDNGIVMGQALIDAYQLETNIAKNPRTVLSDKLLSQLNYPIYKRSDRYPYHQYLDRFDDGCVGFHQMKYFEVLQSWDEMDAANLKAALKKVKTTIIEGLDSSFERIDIHNKFQWLKQEYDKLIILEENLKEKIYDINIGIAGKNIHYKYTDDFYFPHS